MESPHFSRKEHARHGAPSGMVTSELVAYVDGGCLGNPGPSGIGVVISGCASGPVRIAKWNGHQDNNVAEYAALMEALQYAVSRKAQKLHVYSDSEVVVRQMTGEYECRSARLYSLHWTCRKLARSLTFSISHVRREENAEANGLAQAALRRRPVANIPERFTVAASEAEVAGGVSIESVPSPL